MTDGNTMRKGPTIATASRFVRLVVVGVAVTVTGCGGPTVSDEPPRPVADLNHATEPQATAPVDDNKISAADETATLDSNPDNQAQEIGESTSGPSSAVDKPGVRLATKDMSDIGDETTVSITQENPRSGSTPRKEIPADIDIVSQPAPPTNATSSSKSVAKMAAQSPAEASSAAQEPIENSSGRASYPDAYFELPVWNREGPQGATRVSFDDFDLLKIMGLDPVPADVGPDLPERIQRLDGMRVRLRGFMYPPYATEGLRGFVLARDNEICCFGRSPKIYDLVPVELSPGVTTRYIEGRPFDVVGVIHVAPEADDEELYQLFYMDHAIVIE